MISVVTLSRKLYHIVSIIKMHEITNVPGVMADNQASHIIVRN
jgi:hypothetical protein